MATTYPTTLDTLPNPDATTTLNSGVTGLNHSAQHANANDAIEALQAKVGVDNSAVVTSHDYRIVTHAAATVAHGATGAVAGTDNVQTLTNKTISAGSNTFTGVQLLDSTLTSLAALNATAGLLTQTAADTFTKRTLTGANAKLAVTNGDGAAGAPVLTIGEANFTGIAQSSVPGLADTVANSKFNVLEGNGGAGVTPAGLFPASVVAVSVTVSTLYDNTSVLVNTSYDVTLTNTLFIGQLRVDGVLYPDSVNYQSTNMQYGGTARMSISNHYRIVFEFAGTHLIEMLASNTSAGASFGGAHTRMTVAGAGIY